MPHIWFRVQRYRSLDQGGPGFIWVKQRLHVHYYNLMFPGDVAEGIDKNLIIVDRVEFEDERHYRRGPGILINSRDAEQFFLYRRPLKNWILYWLTCLTGRYMGPSKNPCIKKSEMIKLSS